MRCYGNKSAYDRQRPQGDQSHRKKIEALPLQLALAS